jgi:hypothetical protein
MTVAFCSHPVSGDVDANIKSALAWIRYLRPRSPGIAIMAPWIPSILAGEDDNDPEQRERGLLDCEAWVRRCDGVILCGGRISHGMQREIDAIVSVNGWVSDLTSLGPVPPAIERFVSFNPYGLPSPVSVIEWGRGQWHERRGERQEMLW